MSGLQPLPIVFYSFTGDIASTNLFHNLNYQFLTHVKLVLNPMAIRMLLVLSALHCTFSAVLSSVLMY